MKKLFLSVIGIAALLLFFPGDGLAADHVKAEPVKADPAKVAPVKAAPDDDLENALKAQVDALRKIKGEYQHTRNVQHFRDTEDDYLWGASLYRLGRWREALAMFTPATPPTWKVRSVSCVPGSPILWAATMPTAVNMSIGRPRPRSRP